MMTDVDFHTHLPDQTGNYQTALSVRYQFSEGESVCVCVCVCVCVFKQSFICGYVLYLQLLILDKWLFNWKVEEGL